MGLRKGGVGGLDGLPAAALERVYPAAGHVWLGPYFLLLINSYV